MNPLMEMMMNGNPMIQKLTQFNEFKKNWTDASAQKQIDAMLASGKVTKEQVEQARRMAEQFKGILK